MYYYNQHNSYDSNSKLSTYYHNQQHQHHSNMKSGKSNNHQHTLYNQKPMNFSGRFVDQQQRYTSDYDISSTYSNGSSLSMSPTSFLPGQYYNGGSYNHSLSSSFESDDSSSYLTVSLSSSTSSLEFGSDSGSPSFNDGQPIWSSALYSPNLHPGLFESWSAKMNKSILQLNEELKNYDKNIGNYMAFDYENQYSNTNMGLTNQIENLNQMSDLFNRRQPQQFSNPKHSSSGKKNAYQYQCGPITDTLISYAEMTTKVDDLLDLSFNQENVTNDSSVSGKSLRDITNFQTDINVCTSNENLEDSDDKLTKSMVSPKLKFTAPRFEKKWLKTQTKAYPIPITYATPIYSNTNQNMSEISPKLQRINGCSNNQKQLKNKNNESDGQCRSVNRQTTGVHNNRWTNQSTLKSTVNNNNALKYTNSYSKAVVSNQNAQNNPMNCHANNESSNNNNNYGNNNNGTNSNGTGYRLRNKHNNNRYRYRASSKSRA